MLVRGAGNNRCTRLVVRASSLPSGRHVDVSERLPARAQRPPARDASEGTAFVGEFKVASREREAERCASLGREVHPLEAENLAEGNAVDAGWLPDQEFEFSQ